jgi:hypothetical protein
MIMVMENNVQQGATNAQVISNVIINKSELSEAVHEETDARTSGADHLSQSFLT